MTIDVALNLAPLGDKTIDILYGYGHPHIIVRFNPVDIFGTVAKRLDQGIRANITGAY